METSRIRRPAASLCVLSWLFLAASCSILDPDPSGITLRNRTGAPVVVLAWELESTHVLDLSPSVNLSSGEVQVLESGASRFLAFEEISGGFHLGDDLALFLYEVLGETAEYRSFLTLSASTLRDQDYRVTLR